MCGGIEGDRDIVSAAMAATVALTDTSDPRTARIDHNQRQRLHDQSTYESTLRRS